MPDLSGLRHGRRHLGILVRQTPLSNDSRDLLLQASTTGEQEQALGETWSYPHSGSSQRETIISWGHYVHELTRNNQLLSLAVSWNDVGWLSHGCAQVVVEGRRGKSKQEDDPSGQLVPRLQEPFKQATLGCLCTGTMTGKRVWGLGLALTPGCWMLYSKPPRSCIILTGTQECHKCHGIVQLALGVWAIKSSPDAMLTGTLACPKPQASTIRVISPAWPTEWGFFLRTSSHWGLHLGTWGRRPLSKERQVLRGAEDPSVEWGQLGRAGLVALGQRGAQGR